MKQFQKSRWIILVYFALWSNLLGAQAFCCCSDKQSEIDEAPLPKACCADEANAKQPSLEEAAYQLAASSVKVSLTPPAHSCESDCHRNRTAFSVSKQHHVEQYPVALITAPFSQQHRADNTILTNQIFIVKPTPSIPLYLLNKALLI